MTRIALIDSFLKAKVGIFILIIFYLFTFINVSSASEKVSENTFESEKDIPVYVNDKKIGYLNEQMNDISTLENEEPFFILETFNIFSKTVTIKSNVTMMETRNKDKSYYFFNRNYEVTLEKQEDYAIISVRDTNGAGFYQIYIRKNEKNQLEIFKETAWDSVSVMIEIGNDDFDSKRADLICQREEVKVINDIIYVPDSLNLNKENKKACYTKIIDEQ